MMNVAEVYAVVEDATGSSVKEDTSLDSLPLDSLELLELMLNLSEVTGKQITDAQFAQMSTVGDLVEALR